MKKILLLLLLQMLLLSCVSLPDPSESTTGLLVIPLGLENKVNLKIFGNYRLTFTLMDDGSTFTRRMTPSNSLSQIFLEPGEYKLTLVEFIYDGGGVNNKTSEKLYDTFTIKQGEILIFPRRFITKNYLKGDSQYMSRTMVNTSLKDRTYIKEYLSKLDNFYLWLID